MINLYSIGTDNYLAEEKMEYKYLGYNEEMQIVKGRVSAIGEQAALDMLANIGYRIINLKPITSFLPDMGTFFKARVKQTELTTFSRQLALLIESGVGIVHSLELLQGQANNKEFKRVLIHVISELRNGSSLSAALLKYPYVFSNIYSKMVGVGEQTGGLEGVLRNLADYIERESGAIKKLKTALTYPCIVLGLSVVVGIILVVVVLPPIVSMFSSLGGELPIPTRILLWLVDFMTQYIMFLLIIVIGIGLVGFMYARSPSGRLVKDKIMLKLPIIGKVVLLGELSRSCRSLSLLFKAGLPLPEIMTLTAQSSGNRIIASALNEVELDLLNGDGLSKPLRRRKVFLPLMVEMAKVGEETGNLDEVLIVVAQNYEIEAESRVQTILSMVEPAMTVMVGLGVGFLALSIFLPMYSSLSLVG
jgi:type IV pilus assembly protein PilC